MDSPIARHGWAMLLVESCRLAHDGMEVHMAPEQSQNDQARHGSQRKPACFAAAGIRDPLESLREGTQRPGSDRNVLARV
ncbi:MAG: hypothetical protein KF833_06875 [Verrucomicrobiae bacterium]|nr:hypothetical protein [Verrucomicrobiae bacterium]